MPSFSKNKKVILTAVLIAIIIGRFFVWQAGTAKGADTPTPGMNAGAGMGITPQTTNVSPISGTLMLPINTVLYLLFSLQAKVITLIGGLVQGVLDEKITSNGIVAAGWNITRDLCNMFFALILLVMAFSTILQIETFGAKSLLKKLVIAALLINFSLVFAGIIIDFSQILANYFINSAIGTGISAKIMDGLGVNKLFQTQQDPSWWNIARDGYLGAAVPIFMGLLMANIVLLVATFSLLAFIFFLIVRILWLWFLLIVSPFAWVSMIIPGSLGGNLWRQWWSKLFSWSFFAPIYMFFLYLGLRIAQTRNTVQIADPAGNQFMSTFFTLNNILRFVFIIATMLGGLVAAQAMGVRGASGAMALGKSMVTGTGKLFGKYAGRWAARGAEAQGKPTYLSQAWASFRRGTSYLAPKPWKDAWAKRQQEQEKRAYPVATGARQDLLNRVMPWVTFGIAGRVERTDFRERAIRARETEERKNITATSPEEIIGSYKNAEKANNPIMIAASLHALAEQGNISKLMLDTKNPAYTTDTEGFQKFVKGELVPRFGQEQAFRLAHDIGKTAAGTGDFMAAGAYEGKYNPQTKKTEYKEVPVEKAAASSAVMQPKGAFREQIRTTKSTSYIKEGYDPEKKEVMPISLSEAGEKRIRTLQATAETVANLPQSIKMNLMVNFAGKVNDLNPGLYSVLHKEFSKLKKENSATYNALKSAIKEIKNPSSWEKVAPAVVGSAQMFSHGGGI